MFEVDPVRYHKALGDTGLIAYRQAVAAREHEDTFAVRYARERLAVLDGDTQAIVRLPGGDLTRPHQFAQVAEAMAELGRDDDALACAMRGIAETQGWQTARLYDLACETHARAGSCWRCFACAAPNTSGSPRFRPTTASGAQPRRLTRGRSSATPPAPSCANATGAR